MDRKLVLERAIKRNNELIIDINEQHIISCEDIDTIRQLMVETSMYEEELATLNFKERGE